MLCVIKYSWDELWIMKLNSQVSQPVRSLSFLGELNNQQNQQNHYYYRSPHHHHRTSGIRSVLKSKSKEQLLGEQVSQSSSSKFHHQMVIIYKSAETVFFSSPSGALYKGYQGGWKINKSIVCMVTSSGHFMNQTKVFLQTY